MTRIGIAGWSYADWQGPVYPRRKPRGFHPLAYLSRYVDLVELNASFYALPDARHAARWASLVADRPGFRFLVKLYRGFTHEAPHADWGNTARAFRSGIEPLSDAGRLLGLLVQFPLHFRRSAAGWDRIERIRDHFAADALSLEFRHRSWFVPETYARLGTLQLGLVHIDLPASPEHPPAEHPVLGPLAYLRLHGRNRRTWFDPRADRDQKYDYHYTPTELESVARRIERISADAEHTVVVTNNHYGGQAVANALQLKQLLTGIRPPAPEPLRMAFPELAGVTRAEGQQLLF